MAIGWKIFIPAGLAWVMVTAALVVLPQEVDRGTLIAWIGPIFGLAAIVALGKVTRDNLASLRAMKEGVSLGRR